MNYFREEEMYNTQNGTLHEKIEDLCAQNKHQGHD